MDSTLSWSADIVNTFFAALSIYGAHSFYKSTKSRWKTILTWAAVVLFCVACGEVTDRLISYESHERYQMFIGFCGVFAYIYLFKSIPIAQRMFTYFLVDCSIYLTVIVARVISMLPVSLWNADADLSFLISFVVCTLIYLLAFNHHIRRRILETLPTFRRSFGGLTVFSALSYISVLLLVDAWGPWPVGQPVLYAKYLVLVLAVCAGYYMAFHTLAMARKNDETDLHYENIQKQLTLNERYYDNLLDSIEQAKIRNHDLRHHVNALNTLSAEGRFSELGEYLREMKNDLPSPMPAEYCQEVTVNALLNHYNELCRLRDIPFDCAVRMPKECSIEPLHICVIFGNALQNALEASEKLSPESEPFISCKAAYDQGKLAITVENRFDGVAPKKTDSGGYASSKTEGEHGIGLQSISNLVEKYKGWYGTDINGDIFTLKLFLTVENKVKI